ncbi:G protein-coupled receptor-like protein [Suid betaherpesvirus 2]|uniref:G protein-coupled receptor-like protein n=1 Tax=Suid betaherpesvirus 2 TaxID=1608255 RepID=U3GPZ8_9BETA|nr:G protein-coupled receptor-like protein [Suid betaherpesvirus 2]AGT99210.1 G protein-coupled receptor-like protein [Suid betaherpesvirus 2]
MQITILLITINRHKITSLSKYTCTVLSITYFAACTSSFTIIGLISLNRYRAITVINVKKDNPNRTHIIAVLLVYVLSYMCASPAPIYTVSNDNTCAFEFSNEIVKSILICLKVIICMLWGVFPLAIMTFFYIRFLRVLRNKTADVKIKKTLTFVSVLIATFLVIQTPYLAALLYEMYFLTSIKNRFDCSWEMERKALNTSIRFLPHVHLITNPLAYAFSGMAFRTKFMEFVRCRLCDKKNFLRSRSETVSKRTEVNMFVIHRT